jgi:hypothetical protein
MDPNATLAELRALAARATAAHARGYDADPDDSTRIVELFESLDGWLQRGGFLPAAWAPCDICGTTPCKPGCPEGDAPAEAHEPECPCDVFANDPMSVGADDCGALVARGCPIHGKGAQ